MANGPKQKNGALNLSSPQALNSYVWSICDVLRRSNCAGRFSTYPSCLGCSFYDLRHTHATLLLKAGVHPKIVSERLGHSNISLTLDTYSHVLPGMQDEAADKLNAMLFSGVGLGSLGAKDRAYN
ncbi:hypothetical protein BH24DEI1_BH24DEI1_09520 [soil metagenome]|jgi:integrase